MGPIRDTTTEEVDDDNNDDDMTLVDEGKKKRWPKHPQLGYKKNFWLQPFGELLYEFK